MSPRLDAEPLEDIAALEGRQTQQVGGGKHPNTTASLKTEAEPNWPWEAVDASEDEGYNEVMQSSLGKLLAHIALGFLFGFCFVATA